MRRWLYFVVSCTAAIGIACGDDSGGGIDARPPIDGSAAVDGKVFDAGAVSDAKVFDGGATADAKTFDAPPTFDANNLDASQIDANPNCVSDPACTAAGNVCVDADTVGTCVQIAPGCFQLSGTNTDCTGTRGACNAGVCTCIANAECSAGAGDYCDGVTAGGKYTCVLDSQSCPVRDHQSDCAGAAICGGSAGAATCSCPTGNGTNEGEACSTLQAQSCSADLNEVLVCSGVPSGDAGTCNVLTVLDRCNADDGTGDGLSCDNNQCVCPANNSSDFYANPVVARPAPGSPRFGLTVNGRRTPAICTFPTLTLALDHAKNPDFAFTGKAIASNDNPAVPGVPAVFRSETHPWVIPSGRIMTTVSDGLVGGNSLLNPADFVVVVNTNTGDASASVILEGQDSRAGTGGILRGITLVEGTCGTGQTCNLPGIALQIHLFGEPTSQRIDRVAVEGGGGAQAFQDSTNTIGNVAANIAAAVNGDGTVTLTDTGAGDLFSSLDEADSLFIGITGAANSALNGFFLVQSVDSSNEVTVKNADVDPAAADETFDAQLGVTIDRDWQIGVQVLDANVNLQNLVVRNFASFDGDANRIGLLVVSDFTGSPPTGQTDEVIVGGGLFSMNDTGIAVGGNNPNTFINLSVPVSSGGTVVVQAQPTTIRNSMNIGLDADNGTLDVTGLVESFTWPDGGEGVGVAIHGDVDAVLNGISVTANDNDGLTYDGSNGAVLVDNLSHFDNNGDDGVDISGGLLAKPQVEGADITLNASTVSGNASDGVEISSSDFVVSINGGEISSNDGDGINLTGNSTLVTGLAPGGAVSNLLVKTNGRSGLFADDGVAELNGTLFSANGQTNICPDVPPADLADMAVRIGSSAQLHAVGIGVSDNRGGGIDINTTPNGSGNRQNTIDGSTIDNNQAVDTCPSANDQTAGPGIHVEASGSLQFVNDVSSISGNARVGLYVSGDVKTFTDRVGPPAETQAAINVNNNGWDGLVVASAGEVDLIAGSSANTNGIIASATEANGNDGILVLGNLTATGTEIAGNGDDGIVVNLATGFERAILTFPSIHNNNGDGIRVLSAPGGAASGIDSLASVVEATYGLLVRTNPGSATKSSVFSNNGDGINVGSATQTQDINAKLGDINIFDNVGVGIRVRQATANGAGVGCVAAGCTGVTILSNRIFTNDGGGVELRTAFLKRLDAPGTDDRGFAGNDIFHNALNTCAGPQTAAQIVVNGATGLEAGVCPAQLDSGNCVAQNDPTSSSNDNAGFNNQCMWTGSACVVSWDLSPSPIACDQPNFLRDYIRGSSNTLGGLFATQGAKVRADRNNWILGNPQEGQDYTTSSDPGTLIQAGAACSGVASQCVESRP